LALFLLGKGEKRRGKDAGWTFSLKEEKSSSKRGRGKKKPRPPATWTH